jgi:hypothetical protein
MGNHHDMDTEDPQAFDETKTQNGNPVLESTYIVVHGMETITTSQNDQQDVATVHRNRLAQDG